MLPRTTLLAACCIAVAAFAQDEPLMRTGTAYTKTVKGLEGDLQLLTNGVVDGGGRPVVIIMEGKAYKAARLDASNRPTEEFSLSGLPFDGLKWEAVTSVRDGDDLVVLFVSNGKKQADYGIGRLNTQGALAITGFQKVASFPQANVFDPQNTTCKKTLPDLILFDNGAAYDQSDRLVRSPDGQHYLLNHYTAKQKGPKVFWYACLDRSFNVEWQGEAKLPYEDMQSDVHQITLGNDGTMHLLTYVFACADPERASDKLCHETHITVLRDQGRKVRDLLLDKDFVASARILPKADGRLLIAMRYGALTGQPGWLITLDTAITKLKPTPLTDQRVPAIRKVKLTAFGMSPQEKKPGGGRQVKVPDEIIDIVPAWNGGALLVEGFRDPQMEINVGEAVALRTLHGAIRATYLDENDSTRWERTVERAFITTAGEAYGSVVWSMEKEGVQILYNHTPGGIAAMANIYSDADVKKKGKDAPTVEPSAVKCAWIPSDGGAPMEKTLLKPENNFTFCPMTAVFSGSGDRFWMKGFDRGGQHLFGEVSAAELHK